MYQQVVYINSAQRSNGVPENFSVTLAKPLKSARSVLVKSVEIPFTYYVVTTSTNTLVFNGGGVKTVTIAVGNYSGNTLATAIQTAMNATAFTGTTVVYNDITNKLVFTNLSAFLLVLAGTTMAEIIGLSANTLLATSTSPQNIVNIAGTNQLYIISNILQGAQNIPLVNSSILSCLHRVVVDVGPTQFISDKVMAAGANVYKFSGQNDIYEITFQLVDEDFNQIDLNGANWNIELHISTDIL